jgi:hypothetical protein
VTTVSTYRARLRVRLQKKVKIDATEHRFTVAWREVVLSPPTPEQTISDSEWLIMNSRGERVHDERARLARGSPRPSMCVPEEISACDATPKGDLDLIGTRLARAKEAG